MSAPGKSLSYLACVLLIIALAAHDPVNCAGAGEKHNVNNNNKNAAVGVVSTAAPVSAKITHHVTTSLPLKATHLQAASVAPVVHHDKSKVVGVAPVVAHATAHSAAAHPPAHVAVSVAPALPITKAPAANQNAAHAAAPALKATTVAPAHVGVPQRLAVYFEPICHQVDKLEPKQMFKIQAQMKQFIEKTAGKMSLCFMQHYSIDPNLTPVNKVQLGAICSSRPLGIGVKGSFKNFQACAEQNWDKNLDIELERINRSCENCAPHPAAAAAATATVKTGHSTAKPAVVSSHDQQNVKEATVISDVVSKVFNNNQGALNKTDIKMIDVGPRANGAAGATVTNQLPSKEVLNDPNTMVVFVDEPTKTGPKHLGATAAKPVAAGHANHAAAKSSAPVAQAAKAAVASPAKPALAGLLTTLAPKSLVVNGAAKVHAAIATVKPAGVVANKVVAKSSVAPASGSIKPTNIPVATGARSGLGDKILSAVSTIQKLGKGGSTTAKPAGGKSTTAKADSSSKSAKAGGHTTTGAPKKGGGSSSATTKKPSGAPKGGSSTGKPHTTAKSKATSASTAPGKSSAAKTSSTKKPAAGSSTAAPTGKAKIETDAKDAIKALQLQRAQQTHGASDAHLHLFEHQRQMAIDPIGHTIKHQQYEQRRAAAAASAALAGAYRH